MPPFALLALALAGLPPAGPGYAASRHLDSPHATQAAAADGASVYAVSSTKVARLDRATGRETGVSRGAAEHLNSAFVWEGKLYLAHSNYPKTPHRSDLRVLDPATMELATHHDFPDPPGSLTWAVRRGGEWWCFFARYGAENGRSVLVRYADGWRESGRWTLPPELVADLGAFSLSGGVWDGGVILATGHDERKLYRLTVPPAGGALGVAAVLRSPFPGQGIAVDPSAPRGLVGIDRAARRVVFARPE